MMQRLAIALALAAALFIMVAPALAGGWAVITLDALPPEEVNPGETLILGFMVRQHGQTPVHSVDFLQNQPVVPLLTAVNQATGDRLQVEATRDEKLGHYTAQITLPSAGEWALTISPDPLEGQLALEPVRVGPAGAPAVQAPASEPVAPPAGPNGGVPIQAALGSAGLVLLALAAIMALAGIVERRKPVVAEAGD